MIRYIFCMKRKENISHADFRRQWHSAECDQIFERMKSFYGDIQISRSNTLQIDVNDWIQNLRNTQDPFDGIMEYSFKSGTDFIGKAKSPEAIALLAEMTEFLAGFVDFSKSSSFFTEMPSFCASE